MSFDNLNDDQLAAMLESLQKELQYLAGAHRWSRCAIPNCKDCRKEKSWTGHDATEAEIVLIQAEQKRRALEWALSLRDELCLPS